MATCHPDRPHASKGLCGSCATRRRLQENPALHARHKARALAAKWANHGKSLQQQFRTKYGIEIRETLYNELLAGQGSKCAICGLLEADHHRKFSLDHDHESQKTRGLLCSQCNAAIGLLKDSSETCEKAVAYLKTYGK